jgi:hypothetical protein
LRGDDGPKPIRRSLYSFLLEEMAQAAKQYALANNVLDPDDFAFDLLGPGISVVNSVRSALIRNRQDKTEDFWDFNANPIAKIKAKKVPHIDRSSVEAAVDDYLALPYRTRSMDRFLVRLLIAVEMYAFGDEMFNEETFGLYPARSPLKQRHALLAYLRGQIVNGLFLGAIGAAALWASSNSWLGESTALWIVGGCVSLFLLFAATSTVLLPYMWFKQAKARNLVRTLIAEMASTYNDLKSDGPISAQHVRDRANDATRKGVGWPAPLFALLDDIIARNGRF